MDRRVRRFRQEVERLGLGRVGGRYPAWLRAEALAILGEQAPGPVAAQLGVAVASLERWRAQASGRAGEPTFCRVEVEAVGEGEPASGWVVVTPRGYRVEGRDAATLLRVLSELS